MIHFNYEHVLSFLSKEHLLAMEKEATSAKNTLLKRNGAGNAFLGWVDLPEIIPSRLVDSIQVAANQIRSHSDVLVVIGIGGSYLGAKAALDFMQPYFQAQKPEIIFVGHTLSSTYTQEVLDYVRDKSFSVNVISKSGTTTEPAIAFRLFKTLLETKYGSQAKERIFVTTDEKSGSLRHLTNSMGYTSFIIPDDIGGRYSVLTPVGLLPIACAGISIQEMLAGAKDACHQYKTNEFLKNDAMLYASLRNLLYRQGKKVEFFVSYEPKLHFLMEWLKQLFGESEGKDHKGILPSSLTYSTDLHSMGQFVQDGSRMMFETIIHVTKPNQDIILDQNENDLDGLNYLATKTLNEVNTQAMLGTILAHVEGGVPNMVIELDALNPYQFGYIVYFFMFSCAISGYILGVNPFDQEGVEAYKRNMFALLGKKGYEALGDILRGKLKQ